MHNGGAAKLDSLLQASPRVALVLAISLSERCVLLQRTRADLDEGLDAILDQLDNDKDLESTFTAPPPPEGGTAKSSAANLTLPPVKIVNMYVSIVANCAAPFSNPYDAHPHAEWSVLRFHLPQWEIVALRDTASSSVESGTTSDISSLDFVMLVFSRTSEGALTDGDEPHK
jgi:hypothetical protein